MNTIRELAQKYKGETLMLGVFLLVVIITLLWLLVPRKGTGDPSEDKTLKWWMFETKKTDDTTWLMIPKGYSGELETIAKTPDAVYLVPEKEQIRAHIDTGFNIGVCKIVRNEAFKEWTLMTYEIPIKSFIDNSLVNSINFATEAPKVMLSITDNWEIRYSPQRKYQGVIKDKTSFQILNPEGREISSGSAAGGVLVHSDDATDPEREYVSKAFLAVALANEKIVI